eukprot:TRINITY_DN761_c0_g1_i1.p1 TRINITY_DN761_c0_g1~~TRINITY_DN761_c0_g1_i1.p1  ORF type:complete len:238 (-),score=54.37 TRINITY_DN761_c0_g1_i1:816-1469(-)
MKVIVFLIALLLPFTFATKGFDLSYFQGAVTQSAFDCLSGTYDFGIIEATAGTGGYNNNLQSDVSKCKAAGMNCDVYIFPDTSQNAASSITTIVNKMISEGVLTNNMIWMDIESTASWSTSCSSNVNWLSEAISTAESLYKGCGLSTCIGIYSSSSQWSPIMCGSTDFKNHQLWYAHYDGNPSFSDFEPFGGWTKPNIKQYQGTTSTCGTQIDEDYY